MSQHADPPPLLRRWQYHARVASPYSRGVLNARIEVSTSGALAPRNTAVGRAGGGSERGSPLPVARVRGYHPGKLFETETFVGAFLRIQKAIL